MAESFKVLVIDGEPDVLALTTQLVREAGYEVTEASTGKAGLELARRERPDLILLDVVLGDENGLEVCREIKNDQSLRHTFVALATGKSLSPAELAEGFDAGAEEYFRRPVQKGEFLARLRTLVRLRNADQALRKSEDRFRTIIENLGDGVFVHDEEGRITLANRAASRNTGYSREELLGLSVADLDPASVAVADRVGLWTELAPGETAKVQSRHRRKDGSEYEAEIHLNAIELGGEPRILAVARDVSARTRAEEALRESERRHRLLAENSTDVIWIMTVDGRFTYISPSVAQLTGFTPEEAMAIPLRKHLTPQSADKIQQILQSELENPADDREPTYLLEVQQYTKDGSFLDVEVSASFLYDEDGNPLAIQGTTRDISERKETERRLEESRAKLLEAQYLAGIGDFTWTPDTGEVVWSEGLYRMLEYNVGETIDEGLLQEAVHHPDDRDRINQWLEEGIRSGEEFLGSNEYRILDKHGRTVHVEVNARVQREEGAPVQVFGTCVDITARKEAEKAVRESEERYRAYIDHSPLGVFVTDQNGCYVDVNPAACQMIGYSRDELLGMSIGDLAPQAQEGERMEEFEEMKRNGRLNLEKSLRRKDGSFIRVRLEGVALSGNRYMALCADITEQREAEKVRRESEERYRVLVENADVFVSLYDREGTCLFMNNKVAASFGKHPEELVGSTLWDLHPNSAELYLNRIQEVFDSENAQRFDDTVTYPTGDRCLLSNMQPVRNAEGAAYAVQIISQDITELRKLQEQLSQSQKLEAIGRLAGGVAHDFNNMLTVISNYSDLIFMSLPDHDPMRDDVAEVKKAAGRAAELTQQLLAFSRKQVIKPVVMDMNEAVVRCEKMLRRLIGEDVELEFNPEPELYPVVFDPGQMEQILFNLAVNSKDAMAGGGRLTIETRNVELDEAYHQDHYYTPPGEYALLSLTDTGHGMDPEVQRNIFEPFFTTKATGQGTGLGMSTVYGIVKQHGGSIEVYSEVDEGTTVMLYLPRREGDTAWMPDRPTGRVPRGEETILLVEDDPAVRAVAQRILRAQGYTVIETEGPDEALKTVEETTQDIHMVLSDVIMPGMSGKECFELLLELRPGLRVLYMSGYTESAITSRGVLDEGTHFIQKPFSVERLATMVREVLDGEEELHGEA